MTFSKITVLLAALWLWAGCVSSVARDDAPEEPEPAGQTADVVSVSVTGQAGSYQFSVGVQSPDTGCALYADWWEVIQADGSLVYRRILTHSHINEQPFVRSGAPVTIQPDTEVIVRAHMHPTGYGGQVFRGSVATGFTQGGLEASFAAEIAKEDPLPTGCAG